MKHKVVLLLLIALSWSPIKTIHAGIEKQVLNSHTIKFTLSTPLYEGDFLLSQHLPTPTAVQGNQVQVIFNFVKGLTKNDLELFFQHYQKFATLIVDYLDYSQIENIGFVLVTNLSPPTNPLVIKINEILNNLKVTLKNDAIIMQAEREANARGETIFDEPKIDFSYSLADERRETAKETKQIYKSNVFKSY